jgi:hypothetical protein
MFFDLSPELTRLLERAAAYVYDHYGPAYTHDLAQRICAREDLMASPVGNEFRLCLFDELDGAGAASARPNAYASYFVYTDPYADFDEVTDELPPSWSAKRCP